MKLFINPMDVESIIKNVRMMLGERGSLKLKDPFKVLITTVLSQRTRDENTSNAAKELFKKYDAPEKLSKASVADIASLIKKTGFYKVKAKRIKFIAKHVALHGMPKKFEDLMKLPGVGRKTANCVLAYCYGVPAIPVDTHVHRISNRLGLVNTKRPEETENALKNVLPKKCWLEFNLLFVKFGQKICRPINPLCNKCLLKGVCKYYNSIRN